MTVWSAEASSRLTELYDEGRSASVIRDLLHREGLIDVTRNAIIGRTHRLKLPARAPRKSQRKPQHRSRQSKQARQNELRRQKRTAERKAVEERKAIPMDPQTRQQLRCEPIRPLSITIYDLTDDTCRFPYGDNPPYVYCGHPTAHGAYCLHHAAVCFGSRP